MFTFIASALFIFEMVLRATADHGAIPQVTYPHNAYGGGYLRGIGYPQYGSGTYGGLVNGYPGTSGGYYNPYGGYSSHYARPPLAPYFNGQLPLGIAGHNGYGSYGGYGGLGNYGGLGGYGSLGTYGGYGHGGYAYPNGLSYNGGLGYSNGAVPYGSSADAYQKYQGSHIVSPKAVVTSSDVVIAHGNAGQSRQWFNRFDRN